jgi:branched-chain amino acid transport system ATP-binding protein
VESRPVHSVLLQARGLTARYGEIEAVHGIDLTLERGTIVALLGANGAGKTSTLRALTGAAASTGTIVFDGAALNGITPERAARLGIAHAPEGRGTLSDFSVAENLALGGYTERSRKRLHARRDRVLEYFPVLAGRQRQLAGSLSGGEQQMLAIARALMMNPQLLLLDEPSLGLAPLVVRHIFDLLGLINREDGVTILVAEQNAAVALAAASHAFILETGRIAASGSSAELSADDSVRKSYLGY